MNLKEAFRYQNKLQRLMDEARYILTQEENVICVENTALLHKVNPQAEDETTVETPNTQYAENITQLAIFLMFLLNERERLSKAIHDAKQAMELDFDGEVSMNAKRREIADIFRNMNEIRSREKVLPGAGVGYKFNAEGNQVSYRCDLKKVVSINFDRNKIRSFAAALNKKADGVSSRLDQCMVITQVGYEPPFDVNDTFDQVFRWHMDQNG